MSAPVKDNNMMWLALAIGGGVLAYTFLRKDIVAVADTAVDTVKKIADLANPISQGNILNTAINSTGQAITSNPNWTGGGAIFDATHKTDLQRGLKYVQLPVVRTRSGDFKIINGQRFKLAKDEKVVTVKGKLVVIVDQADLVNASIQTSSSRFIQLPAREVNGKWQKQVNGQWLPLGSKDTVQNIKGAYVVLMEQAA